MFILQSGVVKIMSTADGDDFVIERLHRGAIINQNVFIKGTVEMMVNAVCETTVSVFELQTQKMAKIILKHP